MPTQRFGVFLLEDHPPTAESLTELLHAVGPFRVVGTARTEMQATEWLQENHGRWDFAIFDLLLADGSGFNVLARLKSLPAVGSVVVFSDFLSMTVREKCLRLGAAAAFPKSDVAGMVEWLVARAGPLQKGAT